MEVDWRRVAAWASVSVLFYIGMRFIAWPLLFSESLPAYELFMSVVLASIAIGFWVGPAMHHIIEPSEEDSRVTLIGVAVGVLLIMVVIFFYAVTHDWEKQGLGTLGDFLGGTLNPILTFLTFVGLIVTILLQQRELHDAKAESTKMEIEREKDRLRAEKQQFEATFFQMLNYHSSIVNSIDVHRSSTKGTLTGRECFKYFNDELLSNYNKVHHQDELQRAKSAYEGLWAIFQKDLGHYFRFLYNLIRFVNQSNFPKTKYIRIVRAQLSDFEMVILFYNVIATDRKRFKEYIEFFTLFDNLPKENLLNRDHAEYYERSAFDENAPKKQLSFVDAEDEI